MLAFWDLIFDTFYPLTALISIIVFSWWLVTWGMAQYIKNNTNPLAFASDELRELERKWAQDREKRPHYYLWLELQQQYR